MPSTVAVVAAAAHAIAVADNKGILE